MSEWPWKVPTVRGTRWESLAAPLYSAEGWPFVNVYCEGEAGHPHPLYLIGSFEPAHAVWEARREVHWSFGPHYVTGDGKSIELHYKERQKGVKDHVRHDPTSAALVGDTVLRTRRDLAFADQSKVRSTFDLHCPSCSPRLTLRSDDPQVQTVASVLWTVGFPEVSLRALLARFVK